MYITSQQRVEEILHEFMHAVFLDEEVNMSCQLMQAYINSLDVAFKELIKSIAVADWSHDTLDKARTFLEKVQYTMDNVEDLQTLIEHLKPHMHTDGNAWSLDKKGDLIFSQCQKAAELVIKNTQDLARYRF